MFCTNTESFVKKLQKRGFTVHLAKDRAEARDIGLSLVGTGSAGFGGSATTSELGLFEGIKAQGGQAYFHWMVGPDGRPSAMEAASKADWYFASTNAITEDGVLVNIDGTGNRVAGMIAGPKRVALFIGRNKFVSDIPAGIARIKREACPKNARRLGLALPCGITGECVECSSRERMCRVTSIIEYVPRLVEEFHLVLIDEELGY